MESPDNRQNTRNIIRSSSKIVFFNDTALIHVFKMQHNSLYRIALRLCIFSLGYPLPGLWKQPMNMLQDLG
jgi:hypothetical protein